MSEPAPGAMAARLAPTRPRRYRLNPLEALERGFALFQATFAREAWRYYLGAAPIVLCFIPMWVIDGQIRVSNGTLLFEAAVLAILYAVRAWTVSSYMQRVRERAFGVPRSKIIGAPAKLGAMGRLLAWKIALSLAACLTLLTVAGAPWFYSACEFASLDAPEGAEHRSLGGCLELASQWYSGGLLLFLMLFPLWIAVWLNGFVLALLLPQLLHSIFGVNTLLSTQMGVFSLLYSSAFWLALLACAWLALDPVVKCTFVVVYQQLRSRREGDDLRGRLASLPREQQKRAEMIGSAGSRKTAIVGATAIFLALLLSGFQRASASAVQDHRASARTVSSSSGPDANAARQARVENLRRALQVESQRAVYRWHRAPTLARPTWLDRLLTRIADAISRAWNAFWKFIGKLWPHLNLSSGKDKLGGWRLKDILLWLVLLGVLTVAVGVFLFLLRRRRQAAQLSIPLASAPLAELGDDAVASDRSEDEWFALADRLEAKGELRLSLRAAYLALLAGLAQRDWLTIRRDRTNREYLDEFTRRWRRRPQAAVAARTEVPERLRGSLSLFDRVWYGSHVLTRAAVESYRQDQRELLAHV